MSTSFWRWIAVMLGAASLAACARADAPGECVPYELRFAPGAVLRFRHRVEGKRTTEETSTRSLLTALKLGRSNRESRTTTETFTRTEVVELRREGNGYVMTTRPEAALVTRDGKAAGVVERLPYETPLTFELDATGKVLRLRGFEDIAERLRAAATTDQERATAATVTPDGLAGEREAEWRELVSDWSGARGCLREFLVADGDVRLRARHAHYRRALRARAFTSCELGRCLAAERRYHEDVAVTDSWVKGHVTKPGFERMAPGAGGHVTVVLHPETLRPVSAEAVHFGRQEVERGSETTLTATYERLQHHFEYD